MKRIYIVRHAKSSWSDMSLSDIQRTLNKRGRKDAPIMAQYCIKKNYIPELMISSNAVRAQQTSKLFQSEYQLADAQYTIEPKLYHAPEHIYFERCFEVDKKYGSIMLFGHNPGITYLANSVSNSPIDNVPTCGVLVLDADVKNWAEVDSACCSLVDFLYPKMLG